MNTYIAPNMNSSAIIIIDMQNDFVIPGSVAEVQGSYDIKDNLVSLLKVAREKAVPIKYIKIWRSFYVGFDFTSLASCPFIA
jgi:nicotinamidase-related amidase